MSKKLVTLTLRALRSGTSFAAAHELVVSPTYVPDLVHTSLDLLIDQESGIWHLSNAQAISWAELALKVSEMAGVNAGTLESKPYAAMNFSASRPLYSALTSEKGLLLPTLDDALQRYLRLQEGAVQEDYTGQQAALGGQN